MVLKNKKDNAHHVHASHTQHTPHTHIIGTHTILHTHHMDTQDPPQTYTAQTEHTKPETTSKQGKGFFFKIM